MVSFGLWHTSILLSVSGYDFPEIWKKQPKHCNVNVTKILKRKRSIFCVPSAAAEHTIFIRNASPTLRVFGCVRWTCTPCAPLVVLLYTRSGDATSPHLATWHIYIYIRQKNAHMCMCTRAACILRLTRPVRIERCMWHGPTSTMLL